MDGDGEPISETEALEQLRQRDDQSRQYYAAWWLGRMRSRHPEAVPLLLAALSQRQPRDVGAGVEHNAVARNAARALGKIADARAVPEFAGAPLAEPSSPGHPPVDRGSSPCTTPHGHGMPGDRGGICHRMPSPGALRSGARRIPLPHSA
jgi:hypothetical protein